MKIAFVSNALNDAEHCGDQGSYWMFDGKWILFLADGLGHGEHAESAALAARDYVGRHLSDPLPELFRGCDKALNATRGVAMGVAIVDPVAGAVTYGIIGNIHGVIIGNKDVSLSAFGGIVGAGFKKFTPETVPFDSDAVIAMFTDGIRRPINFSHYDPQLKSDPEKLSEAIMHDWRQETDDAAVLVARNQTCQGYEKI